MVMVSNRTNWASSPLSLPLNNSRIYPSRCSTSNRWNEYLLTISYFQKLVLPVEHISNICDLLVFILVVWYGLYLVGIKQFKFGLGHRGEVCLADLISFEGFMLMSVGVMNVSVWMNDPSILEANSSSWPQLRRWFICTMNTTRSLYRHRQSSMKVQQ